MSHATRHHGDVTAKQTLHDTGQLLIVFVLVPQHPTEARSPGVKVAGTWTYGANDVINSVMKCYRILTAFELGDTIRYTVLLQSYMYTQLHGFYSLVKESLLLENNATIDGNCTGIVMSLCTYICRGLK